MRTIAAFQPDTCCSVDTVRNLVRAHVGYPARPIPFFENPVFPRLAVHSSTNSSRAPCNYRSDHNFSYPVTLPRCNRPKKVGAELTRKERAAQKHKGQRSQSVARFHTRRCFVFNYMPTLFPSLHAAEFRSREQPSEIEQRTFTGDSLTRRLKRRGRENARRMNTAGAPQRSQRLN